MEVAPKRRAKSSFGTLDLGLGVEEVLLRVGLTYATTLRSHLKKQRMEQKRHCKFRAKKRAKIVAAQVQLPAPHQKRANTAADMAKFDISRDFLPLHEHASDAEVMVKRSLIHANPVRGMVVFVRKGN